LIPGPSVERLKAIGAWMKVNGEAIYGTSASPFKHLPWGRCTKKPVGDTTTLYLHVFNWPADGRLVVPGLKNRVRSARLLAGDRKLDFQAGTDGVVLAGLPGAPDPVSSTVVLEIPGAPEVGPVPILQEADGSVRLLAAEADLHGKDIAYESGGGKDNIGFWTNPGETASWTFKIDRPGRFQLVAEIASLGQGNFEVILGEQRLGGGAPNTGDYTKFRRTTLSGTLNIATAGFVTVTVKPVAEGWSPINLKSLTLNPVAASP
jgi:alpha-L-fucosidase